MIFIMYMANRIVFIYILMYITGFCLLPNKCDTFILIYSESFISTPSNSQRPLYSCESVKNQRVGLNTPMIMPEHIAKTRSAFLARFPFSRQYFLVQSYKPSLSH